MAEFIKQEYNDLEILAEAGQDSKGYYLVECICKLCNSKDIYRRANVIRGSVKRCKQCNIDKKKANVRCSICHKLKSRKERIRSKVTVEPICKECHVASKTIKCLECDQSIDTSVGKHSKYCEYHYNIHRIAYTLISGAKYRANKLNIEFNLDVEWVKDRMQFCEVTGLKLQHRDVKIVEKVTYSNRHPLTASIDKINPKAGYVKENCRIVCWWYNLAKGTWSDETILEIVKQWVSNKGETFG